MADRTLIFHDADDGTIVHVLAVETGVKTGVYRLGTDTSFVVAGINIGHVDGLGIAGTPAGGVLTVQGDPAGTPVPSSDAGPSQDVFRTPFASANATVVPVDLTADPGAGKTAYAMDILVSVDKACTVTFKTEGGANLFLIYMAADQTVPITLRGYVVATAAHKKIQALTSIVCNISGICNWFKA